MTAAAWPAGRIDAIGPADHPDMHGRQSALTWLHAPTISADTCALPLTSA